MTWLGKIANMEHTRTTTKPPPRQNANEKESVSGVTVNYTVSWTKITSVTRQALE